MTKRLLSHHRPGLALDFRIAVSGYAFRRLDRPKMADGNFPDDHEARIELHWVPASARLYRGRRHSGRCLHLAARAILPRYFSLRILSVKSVKLIVESDGTNSKALPERIFYAAV